MRINLDGHDRATRERLAHAALRLNGAGRRDRSPSIERELRGAIKKVVAQEFPDFLNAPATAMVNNEGARCIWERVVFAQINFWRDQKKTARAAAIQRAEELTAATRKGLLFPV